MSLRSLLSILAVAGVTVACKPAEPEQDPPPAPVTADEAADTFARQICAGLYACECWQAADFGPDEAACVATIRSELQMQLDQSLALQRTWNEQCAGDLIAAWEAWGCLGPTAAFAEASYDRFSCPVLKGTLTEGVECQTWTLGDNCSPELSCVAGVCVSATVPVPVGEPCGYDWEQLPCEAGSYCDYDGALGFEVCKVLPKAGDPCNPSTDYLCGPGSLDLVCGASSGVCELAPGLGEPCFDGFLCGPDLYCDGGQDFTCQAKAEIGEGCGGNAVCPADASCIGNICTPDAAAVCSLGYVNF